MVTHDASCAAVGLAAMMCQRAGQAITASAPLTADTDLQMVGHLLLAVSRVGRLFLVGRGARTVPDYGGDGDGDTAAAEESAAEAVRTLTALFDVETRTRTRAPTFNDVQRGLAVDALCMLGTIGDMAPNERGSRRRFTLARWTLRDRRMCLMHRLDRVIDDCAGVCAPPSATDGGVVLDGAADADLLGDALFVDDAQAHAVGGDDVLVPVEMLRVVARMVEQQMSPDRCVRFSAAQMAQLLQCSEVMRDLSVGGDAFLVTNTAARVAPIMVAVAADRAVPAAGADYLAAVRGFIDVALGTNLDQLATARARLFMAAPAMGASESGEKRSRSKHARDAAADAAATGAGVLFTVCSPYATQLRSHFDGPVGAAADAAYVSAGVMDADSGEMDE